MVASSGADARMALARFIDGYEVYPGGFEAAPSRFENHSKQRKLLMISGFCG
jgi:hypothetical protein